MQHAGIDAHRLMVSAVERSPAPNPKDSVHWTGRISISERASGAHTASLPPRGPESPAHRAPDRGPTRSLDPPDVSTHGHPNSAASARIRFTMHCARDIVMLSATTMGRPSRFKIKHQAQVCAKIGRVGDANDEVGWGLAGTPAEQNIGSDLLDGSQLIEA